MTESVRQTLADTLDYLITLIHDGIRPEEARSRLRSLQMRHSSIGMQLIWEEETYDHSIHYDALLTLPGNGTVSLSYCDDRAMPWPLRGVHRWSDADLVRVNNKVLTVDQAIACLDFIWEESRITDRLVNACLIEEELEKNPVDLSDHELQLAMDSFRRTRKLYKAEDTYRWMERRGVTHPELEQLVASQASIAKLRDRLVANQVQDYFSAHAAGFDIAFIARLVLSDEAAAVEICESIRCGRLNFFEAAQSRFMTTKRSREATSDLFTTIRRREAASELGSALFESAPGSVIGPVRDKDGYVIIRVLSIDRADLDEPTRNMIKNILFEEWLEQRRSAAAIDWLWGNISKTARTARTDPAVNLSHAG
ncbi:MAG TPA: TIGR04500 family putative peptide maturation system protein [Terriglobia bacterium]|nr:TIGR04500 family putative peptide maturation system protein [Terriglobia bacterium]